MSVPRFLPLSTLLLTLAGLAACTTAEEDPVGDEGGGTDDGGTDDGGSTGDDTADTDTPMDVCAELGLPVREWQAGAEQDPTLQALAGDVTLNARDGVWTLSELWTGCESYLFIQDNPAQAGGYDWTIWEQDHREFLQRLPRNTHVFFMASSNLEAKRNTALDELEAEIERRLPQALDTEEEQQWAREHIHYVTDRSTSVDGWVGSIMQRPGWGAGVDRLQHVRYIGSYADYERYSDSTGWFGPNLAMSANEAIYYNFEAERQDWLDADGATVAPVFNGEQGDSRVTVSLPSATEIAAADTLVIDLEMACIGDGEFGTCPAWDYMAYLYMCDQADSTDNPYADTACEVGETQEGSCTSPIGEARTGTFTCKEDGSGYEDLVCSSCDTEISRWITTYHREGRWAYDISPMLPLFEGGGERELYFQAGNAYELYGSLRFSNTGKEFRPTHLQYILASESEDTFEVPATAGKVELATVISQHGQTCGEFCDATHSFTFNGAESPQVARDFPLAGTGEGCMDQVAEGTVPNQYGTWWYGRAGWCPGKEVPTVTHDITSEVDIGGENTVLYEIDDTSQAGTVRKRYWILSSE